MNDITNVTTEPWILNLRATELNEIAATSLISTANKINVDSFLQQYNPAIVDAESLSYNVGSQFLEQEEKITIPKSEYEKLLKDSERLPCAEEEANSYLEQKRKFKKKIEDALYAPIPKSAFDHPFGYLAQEDFLLKLLDEE